MSVYTDWYPSVYGPWTGKTSGLTNGGDQFAIGGCLIGGDIQALQVTGGPRLIDVTLINQSGHARLGGARDGSISVVTYSDPAAGMEHAALSPLPRTDVIASYLRGQGIGYPVACCNARQAGYDPSRAADGSLTFTVACAADGYGVEWGEQLTAGLRTDTAAGSGPSQDDGAASSFGAQAYLQAVAFTGTDVTVTIQHAPDNTTWTTLLAFTAVTGAPQAQRTATAGAVDRYLRVTTTTSGGFSSLAFLVALMRNKVAVSF